ncbi:tRNA lysidine(34) synthetase TilS [Agrococcus sp. Marseille-Q4369]|uniref:tRNA lysidine(34) synthetase TilS n=1 Tax=Agrococcus sp. Marseille-Q4369 TaxID=2810513 RepID=UPI001B8B88BD|nr:tRNA lysidine(34) synthetase TilS [Agrococcus sp. Marseille-Q4369]QUW17738.1 tRNA lysidine(34) synthetase TilS [Agrococcus sp. Marseille-Q4369]
MPESDRRPRLTPAVADVRRAVREALADLPEGALVLVALSGGADSLALAGATAFEAQRAGLRAGAVVVDHQLQAGSAEIAERAAEQGRALGLDPVRVVPVQVAPDGSPEAAARQARYAALLKARKDTGASAVLLGHTLDDQAETVLIGLARGSGPESLWGMHPRIGFLRRPLLQVRRATTHQACRDQGLEPWSDPHNDDERFLRVRVRHRVLPMLDEVLGGGVALALTRTADTLREDAEALAHFAQEQIGDLVEHAEGGLSLDVGGLGANPPALRQRIIRLAVQSEFHTALTRQQTLEVSRLVTDWHGQGPIHLPGIRVSREGRRLVFVAA